MSRSIRLFSIVFRSIQVCVVLRCLFGFTHCDLRVFFSFYFMNSAVRNSSTRKKRACFTKPKWNEMLNSNQQRLLCKPKKKKTFKNNDTSNWTWLRTPTHTQKQKERIFSLLNPFQRVLSLKRFPNDNETRHSKSFRICYVNQCEYIFSWPFHRRHAYTDSCSAIYVRNNAKWIATQQDWMSEQWKLRTGKWHTRVQMFIFDVRIRRRFGRCLLHKR